MFEGDLLRDHSDVFQFVVVFDGDLLTGYEDVFQQVKMIVVDRHLGKNRSVADSEKQIFLCRFSGPLSRGN